MCQRWVHKEEKEEAVQSEFSSNMRRTNPKKETIGTLRRIKNKTKYKNWGMKIYTFSNKIKDFID